MNYNSKKKLYTWLVAFALVISIFAKSNIVVKANSGPRFNFAFNNSEINGVVQYKINDAETWQSVNDIVPDAGGSRWVNLEVNDIIYVKAEPKEGFVIDTNISVGNRGNGITLSQEDIQKLSSTEGYAYTVTDSAEYEMEHVFCQNNGGKNPNQDPEGNRDFIVHIGEQIVYNSTAEERITVPDDVPYEIIEDKYGDVILKPKMDQKISDISYEPILIKGDGTLRIAAGRNDPIDSEHHIEQDTNLTFGVFFNTEDESDPRNGYSIYSDGNINLCFESGNFRAEVNSLGGIRANRVSITDIAAFTIGILNEGENLRENANVGIEAVSKSGSTVWFSNCQVEILARTGFRNIETITADNEADINVKNGFVFDNVDRIHVQTGGKFHLESPHEETITMPNTVSCGYYTQLGEILEIEREGMIQDYVQTVICEVGDFSNETGRYIYENDGGNKVNLESTTATLWSLGYKFIEDGSDMIVSNGYFEVKAGSGLRDISTTDGGNFWFEAGTVIEFRLVPNNGYQYKPNTFSFNGVTNEDVVVPSEEPGVYTFVMPNNPIHVSCVFEEAENRITLDDASGINSADVTLPENVNGTAELVVSDKELTPEQKESFGDVAGELLIGSTLDLGLNEVIDKIGSDESWTTPITDLDSPVTVTLELPKDERDNSGYAVIREHAGEVTIIDAVYDEETGTVSFQTDGFSTYAIAYVKDNSTEGEKIASYEGIDFYKNENGDVRAYDEEGKPVIDEFKCDGTYTYYFQYDGTAMKDRLTYHPDGIHVIYFDENGHETFNNFVNVKKSVEGKDVDDYCYFDVYGYMYVDVVTYDITGTYLYYINEYGVMERDRWFRFSETVKCADGTPWNGAALNYGCATKDGKLVVDLFTTDWLGRRCYLQANGVALY